MSLFERQGELDALLLATRELWHPQPFHELLPDWCARWPALADELLALSDGDCDVLNDDGELALALLSRHVPGLTSLKQLIALPQHRRGALASGGQWAWGIPGRKKGQIEAFLASTQPDGLPVLEWCGGKGHLGRLASLAWQQPVSTLEIDASLCLAGERLARRAGVDQVFSVADALLTKPPRACQVLALHACGELHRKLIRDADQAIIPALDIAPCCYYKGVDGRYSALTTSAALQLTADDARLAVTETVTASSRETRQHERERAWKLAFDAWRRQLGDGQYRRFKPVPAAWMRGSFDQFMAQLAAREGLGQEAHATASEALGWQRWREVKRLSIVRHAFRRALEIWLALDLAVYLENRGYSVRLGSFCERHLTPRNLLISARAG